MDNLPIKQLERNAATPATSEPLWDEILVRRWIGQVYLYFNMCAWRFVFGNFRKLSNIAIKKEYSRTVYLLFAIVFVYVAYVFV